MSTPNTTLPLVCISPLLYSKRTAPDDVAPVPVTRLQFYVYEIARCRRGLNDWIYDKAQKEAAKEKAKPSK